jgi:hypothetical protein
VIDALNKEEARLFRPLGSGFDVQIEFLRLIHDRLLDPNEQVMLRPLLNLYFFRRSFCARSAVV